jgi:hypothetical protein
MPLNAILLAPSWIQTNDDVDSTSADSHKKSQSEQPAQKNRQ